MANETVQEALYNEEKSARIVRGGSAAEGIAGGVGIVLAILGLLNILPQTLLPIATIVLGVALLFQGGSVAYRFSKLLNETAKGRFETSELGIGLTTEVIGGVAVIVLGILSIENIGVAALMPASAIVFGATLIFGSGIIARLNHLQMPKSEEYESFREVARESVAVATGVQILLGLSALTLGIIAVAGVHWMTLTFIALLCVGISAATSGSAVATKMMGAMHHNA
jgi:hypothetical protein